MKTQSPSGSRGRADVRISNLPPWLSLLCMAIYIKEEPAMQIRVLKTLDISYSHSFTLVCRGAILIGSSLVVVLSTLPSNPSAYPRVSVWDRPWDKFANYFETASPQFHFCPGDKNGLVLRP